MWADEAIAGNLYEKIMDALSQTRYYQDLNGNDVLEGFASTRSPAGTSLFQPALGWSTTFAGARIIPQIPS